MAKRICRRPSRKPAVKKKRVTPSRKKPAVSRRIPRPNKQTQWVPVPVVEEDPDDPKK
jgi:hypothetical protein